MVNKRIPLIVPDVGEEELGLIKKVVESGYMTEGPMTKQFEDEFSAYIGVKHSHATTSCSTALELALRVLGVGPGDEIISPDFTYPITAGVAWLVGASPVLVDVDLDSRNMSPRELEKAITPKTKAIIPVSEFGNPLDEEIYEIAAKKGVPVVEDTACSAGAAIGSKKVGSIADISCFSFHPRKIITCGEGGMFTTNDDEISDKALAFKKFGMKVVDGKISFVAAGTNYKLSDILGAVGLIQLRKLDNIIEYRTRQAKAYNNLLSGNEFVQTPVVKKGHKHNYQSYCIYIKTEGIRDNVIKDMKERGIETQIGTYALHLEPAFKNTKRIGKLQNSEKLYRNLLTLPLYRTMTAEDQAYVCENLKEVLEKYS